MRISHALLAATLAIGMAGVASAETVDQPVKRQTLEQVVSSLVAKGYTIREIEMDDGHFEATVIDKQNVKLEAKINGATGEIIRMKRDD